MKQIGIFYGSSSGNTESVAMKIYEKLGKDISSVKDVANTRPDELLNYRKLIFGIPTWGIGELQDDWAVFLPGIEDLDLSGREVALFGLGDQESYPDTFVDALGILYESLLSTGCSMQGFWSTLGYDFMESSAVRDGLFTGLVIDEKNQPQLTDLRISDWLEKIRLNGSRGENPDLD